MNEEPLFQSMLLDHFLGLVSPHKQSLGLENLLPVISKEKKISKGVSNLLPYLNLHPLPHCLFFNYLLILCIYTCKQIDVLIRHPNEVDTALGERLRPEKSFVNDWVRAIRGLSSATTTQVLTQARLIFFCFNWGTDPPRPLVHNSITPKR